MDDDSLEKAVDSLAETITLSTNPKKMAAMKTAKAYGEMILTAAKVTPICIALGGTPAISQLQARQPDVEPHMPSQSQGPVLQGPAITVISTSGGSVNQGYVFKTWEKK